MREGRELDTVLGLSMTPTAVGLVLVEGHEADGEIMDQDGFDVPTRRGAAAISTSEYVAGALSVTRAIADDHRPHAIGVTWSEDSELEASLVLESLSDAGFDNVVAVRSPEAAEALARGIGRAVGYEQTGVCVLEPETIVVSMIDTHDGAVESVAHDGYPCGNAVVDWVIDVFDLNRWSPECLIVVAPDAGADVLAPRLEHALGIPVFAPAEAQVALARGAALASAQESGDRPRGRSRPLSYSAAMTMLVVGALTFVVSISMAAGFHLTSDDGSPTAPPPPAVAESVLTPAALPPVAAAPSPLPIEPPVAVPTLEPEVVPAAEEPVDAAAPVAEAAPLAPALEVQPTPPTPTEKPPLLTRILSRIPGLHPDPIPPVPAAPPEAPPPPP
jgi:hypothetical protein